MNPENHGESNLTAAIAAIVNETLDGAAIERVRQRALQLEYEEGRSELTNPALTPVRMRSQWLKISSLAASVAVSILALTWLAGNYSSMAFSQVVEHVMKIRNVQFTMKFQMHNDLPQVSQVMIRNHVYRIEHGTEQHGIVTLINLATKDVLHLNLSAKIAQRSVQRVQDTAVIFNPIAELAAAESHAVKSLGTDQISGVRVDVYQVKGMNVLGMGSDTEMTLWTDAATHLPVKIEMRDTDPKHKMSVTFDEFVWGSGLGDELFAMIVPDGFSNGVIFREPMDSENDTEKTRYSQDLGAGVLFAGRVPGRLEYDPQRGTVTALLREPEKLQGLTQSPNEFRQWDIATGLLRWEQPAGGAHDFAICASKDLLATVEGQEIQLRRLSTGAILRTWESDDVLGSVAISHDGALVAHGYIRWSKPASKDTPTGGVEIWNVDSGKLAHHFKDVERVDYLAFSPTTHFLVVCSTDWKTKLYNAMTGELAYSMLSGSRAAFSPDGKLLAVVSSNPAPSTSQCRVDIIDIESKVVVNSVATANGNSSSWLLSLSFSRDGSLLAAGDWNGVVTIWNTISGEVIHSIGPLPGGVHCVRFTRDNEIAIGREDEYLTLHRLAE